MNSESMVSASIQGGILAAMVWLVVRMMPSMPPTAKVWLWRLVFVKFALGFAGIANLPLHVLPPSQPIVAAPEALTASAGYAVAAESSLVVATAPGVTWPAILTLAWLAGVALLVACSSYSTLRTLRMVKRAKPVTDPWLIAQIAALLSDGRIRTRVRLLESSETRTALLIWGLQAAIVLPATLARDRESREDTRLMIAHEVAHLANRDLLWNLMTSVVKGIFFFHPLVWLSAFRAHVAQESAADERALRMTGSSLKIYGEMLLRATVAGERLRAIPGVVAMAGSVRSLRERLDAMSRLTERPPLALRLAAFAAIVLMLPGYCLLAAEPAQKTLHPPKAKAPVKPKQDAAAKAATATWYRYVEEPGGHNWIEVRQGGARKGAGWIRAAHGRIPVSASGYGAPTAQVRVKNPRRKTDWALPAQPTAPQTPSAPRGTGWAPTAMPPPPASLPRGTGWAPPAPSSTPPLGPGPKGTPPPGTGPRGTGWAPSAVPPPPGSEPRGTGRTPAVPPPASRPPKAPRGTGFAPPALSAPPPREIGPIGTGSAPLAPTPETGPRGTLPSGSLPRGTGSAIATPSAISARPQAPPPTGAGGTGLAPPPDVEVHRQSTPPTTGHLAVPARSPEVGAAPALFYPSTGGPSGQNGKLVKPRAIRTTIDGRARSFPAQTVVVSRPKVSVSVRHLSTRPVIALPSRNLSVTVPAQRVRLETQMIQVPSRNLTVIVPARQIKLEPQQIRIPNRNITATVPARSIRVKPQTVEVPAREIHVRTKPQIESPKVEIKPTTVTIPAKKITVVVSPVKAQTKRAKPKKGT